MKENKKSSKKGLKKLQTKTIKSKVSSEFDEIPELSDEWFDSANLYDNGKLVARGRPIKEAKATQISIRLEQDILLAFKKTGKGWQTRINSTLRDWLQNHPEFTN
jgi:uncharacterized protein (DUF4415 family)